MLLRLTIVRGNVGTSLLDFAWFVLNAPSLSLSPWIRHLTRHRMGSQPNTVNWGRFSLPPQIISETKRRSETGEEAFESTRRDAPNAYLTF